MQLLVSENFLTQLERGAPWMPGCGLSEAVKESSVWCHGSARGFEEILSDRLGMKRRALPIMGVANPLPECGGAADKQCVYQFHHRLTVLR